VAIFKHAQVREMVRKQIETWIPADAPFDLMLDLMCAIVPVESGRNSIVARHEPTFRWTVRTPPGPAACTRETELVLQKTSWGLCQIMGATARALGFRRWLTELLDPDTNLLWGLKYLYRLGEKFGWDDPDDIISAYNQGSPRREEPGGERYTNQDYVDRVHAEMARQQGASAGT